MANRETRLIIKNSNIVNRPLPNTNDILPGEGIVNTADGRMLFLGATTSTEEFVPAGVGNDANYFEVGSNLYDLQIRNKITKYGGFEGADLEGKILSGTTDGFVLAEISSIQGIDSFVTGGTYNSTTEEITLTLNEGKSDVVITDIKDTFLTGGTLVTNSLVLSLNDGSDVSVDLSSLDTTDTFVTNMSYLNNELTLERNNGEPNLSVNIDSFSGINISSLTEGRVVYAGQNGELKDESGFEYNETTDTLLAGNINTSANGSAFVGTGGLIVGSAGSGAIDYSEVTLTNLSPSPFNETYVRQASGFVLDNGTVSSGNAQFHADSNYYYYVASTGSQSVSRVIIWSELDNSWVVFFDSSGGDFTEGNVSEDTTIGSGSLFNTTLTVNSILADGRNIPQSTSDIVYSNSSGSGSGDLVVHGNLTVLGDAITASTSELYIEDNNFTLNFNDTSDTSVSSIGAGFTIQDGDGLGGDITFDVRSMNGFSGLNIDEIPDISEYTGPNGVSNRAFVTQLNDIVLRSNNTSTPNGVRVLTEFDVLDGGSY